eukprot:COSAG02_NODE_211_length_28730_cov_5.599490_10_plen_316_part_00
MMGQDGLHLVPLLIITYTVYLSALHDFLAALGSAVKSWSTGSIKGCVLMVMMCEGCNDKQASFGSTIDRVKRWCASCGEEHGAVYLGERRMCEGCNDKLASHGTTIDRVKRWCASCGKEHGAVRLCARKMCEQCNDKRASFGSTIDQVQRWCASCGEEHGAVSLRARKMCEHCSLNPARRDRVSKKARWCGDCQGFMLMAEATGRAPAVIKEEQAELVATADANIERARAAEEAARKRPASSMVLPEAERLLHEEKRELEAALSDNDAQRASIVRELDDVCAQIVAGQRAAAPRRVTIKLEGGVETEFAVARQGQ